MAPMGKVIQLHDPNAGDGFELEVTLRGVSPPIWRRLRLAGSLTLRELHHVLQISFGWSDKHLHEFHIGDTRYGMALPAAPSVSPSSAFLEDVPIPDERELKLTPLLRSARAFEYVYDPGDRWTHEVTVKPVPLTARAPRALCLDGECAAPPEGCGGPESYMDLLRVIASPASARARELRAWAGLHFDPLVFDMAAINDELRTAGTKAFLRKREGLYEEH
jgi:Plasmid pRiA4b ORF-3-like protein